MGELERRTRSKYGQARHNPQPLAKLNATIPYVRRLGLAGLDGTIPGIAYKSWEG